MIPLSEAARVLGWNQDYLRKKAKAGEIPGATFAYKRWWFNLDELEAYKLAPRRGPGRPRG